VNRYEIKGPGQDKIIPYGVIDKTRWNSGQGNAWVAFCTTKEDAVLVCDALNALRPLVPAGSEGDRDG
jgi:hypothetical protein